MKKAIITKRLSHNSPFQEVVMGDVDANIGCVNWDCVCSLIVPTLERHQDVVVNTSRLEDPATGSPIHTDGALLGFMEGAVSFENAKSTRPIPLLKSGESIFGHSPMANGSLLPNNTHFIYIENQHSNLKGRRFFDCSTLRTKEFYFANGPELELFSEHKLVHTPNNNQPLFGWYFGRGFLGMLGKIELSSAIIVRNAQNLNRFLRFTFCNRDSVVRQGGEFTVGVLANEI